MQLIKLKNYARANPGFLSRLSKHLNIKNSYLSQIIKGQRPMSHEQAVATEIFTNGEVSRFDCRPIDGAKVWPELLNNRGA